MSEHPRGGPATSTRPRLCYLDKSIDLPVGVLYIGREPTCDIVLDDALASRRHAKLTVRARSTAIEDLDSRNGVIVNGAEIGGLRALADGDRITIGGQELVFQQGARRPTPVAVARVSLSRQMKGPTQIGDPDRFAVATIGRSDMQAPARLEAFRVLAGLADQAFSEGRPDTAERVLDRALAEVLSTTRCGIAVQPELATFAARYSARLARATGKAFWVDYVFDLFGLLGSVMPRDIVDELVEAVPVVGTIDAAAVKSYLVKARAFAGANGIGELSLLYKSEELASLIDRSRG